VVPDQYGTVSATICASPNPISGYDGEAPFCGLQVTMDILSIQPDPSTHGNMLVNWAGGVLYSSTDITGVSVPFTPVLVGGLTPTSPISIPASGQAQFFLVW
jgi:hypothetical protein